MAARKAVKAPSENEVRVAGLLARKAPPQPRRTLSLSNDVHLRLVALAAKYETSHAAMVETLMDLLDDK